MDSAVRVSDFSFSFVSASSNALQDVSFDVPSRSCCAILGNSGSGKSTLLHALAGSLSINTPGSKSGGRMRIGGNDYDPMPRTILFPKVGLVHQEASLMVSGMFETVEEELNASLSQERAEHRVPHSVDEVLSLLNIGPLKMRNPTELSGGELRKVATASILIANPELFLLDHPGVGLDQHSMFVLASMFRKVKRSSTVVFSDTSIDLALLAADHIVVLELGSVIFSGTKEEFLNSLSGLNDRLHTHDWDTLLRAVRASGNGRLQRSMGMA